MKNFNSIKVRLKRGTAEYYDFDNGFQFHKGTIKTHNKVVQTQTHVHFNSIKVRLKHSNNEIKSE